MVIGVVFPMRLFAEESKMRVGTYNIRCITKKDFGKGAPIVFVGDHNCYETDAPARSVSKILKDAIYLTKTPPKGPWRTFSAWGWRDREVSAVEALKLPVNVRNASKGSSDSDKSKNGGYDWIDCGAKIDFLYVSPDIKVETYETFADPRPGKKCYHSDHFPIVCDIKLKK
jgi:endonuclease/exonuclease/phosphatase family metal-dependent hydrolase